MKARNEELDDILEEGQGDSSQKNPYENSEEKMEQDTQKECPQETWHWYDNTGLGLWN